MLEDEKAKSMHDYAFVLQHVTNSLLHESRFKDHEVWLAHFFKAGQSIRNVQFNDSLFDCLYSAFRWAECYNCGDVSALEKLYGMMKVIVEKAPSPHNQDKLFFFLRTLIKTLCSSDLKKAKALLSDFPKAINDLPIDERESIKESYDDSKITIRNYVDDQQRLKDLHTKLNLRQRKLDDDFRGGHVSILASIIAVRCNWEGPDVLRRYVDDLKDLYLQSKKCKEEILKALSETYNTITFEFLQRNNESGALKIRDEVREMIRNGPHKTLKRCYSKVLRSLIQYYAKRNRDHIEGTLIKELKRLTKEWSPEIDLEYVETISYLISYHYPLEQSIKFIDGEFRDLIKNEEAPFEITFEYAYTIGRFLQYRQETLSNALFTKWYDEFVNIVNMETSNVTWNLRVGLLKLLLKGIDSRENVTISN